MRRVAVAEIPLLIEESLQSLVDQVVLMSVKPPTSGGASKDGKGLTEDQAWARVRAQLPLDQKLPLPIGSSTARPHCRQLNAVSAISGAP